MPFRYLARLRSGATSRQSALIAFSAIASVGLSDRTPAPRPIEAIGRGPPGRRSRCELQALSNSLQLKSI